MVGIVLMLIQHKTDTDSRRYQDFPELDKFLDHILKIFEDALRNRLQEKDNFTYDLSDLYEYLDELPQIMCLIYSEECRNYTPHDKNWIKSKLYSYLTTQLTEISINQ